MLLSYYKTTALEDWVTNTYISKRIHTPRDLKIEEIAYAFGIFLHVKEIPARYDVFGHYKAINVDKRSDLPQQKEQFYHELCHILRHVGHQTLMPKAFRELQEWDANHFTMYAAIPYHMLRTFDLNSPFILEELTSAFEVSEELCMIRLTKIKNNIMALQLN